TIDLSRFLVQRTKHYFGGRLQQGRVLLDSDFNEQGERADEDRRRALADILGLHGSPDLGFSISKPPPIPEGSSDVLAPGAPLPVGSVRFNGSATGTNL